MNIGGKTVALGLVAGVLTLGGCLARKAGQGPPPAVLTGIDLLESTNFKSLKGKRIGLVTNLSAVDSHGTPTLDVLLRAPGVKVRAVFSPEHGLAAKAAEGAAIASGEDNLRGVKVYSLYGKTTKPFQSQLRGLHLLVVDLPDVGTRFYTYPSTAAQCMEAAAKTGIPVLILDRPNPINGVSVEGPVLKRKDFSFTGYAALPIRHGMTLGELARFMNGEKQIGAKLKVLKIQGWKRTMWFDETGLPWTNPSPNLRSLSAAILYPGVCLLEPTNMSVGRGTDAPFERFGAPWINSREASQLAKTLNEAKLPGVKFQSIQFTPKASLFEGQSCGGCRLELTDRDAFQPVLTGMTIISTLIRSFGDRFESEKLDQLLRSVKVRKALQAGTPVEKIVGMYQRDEKAFMKTRKKYLLY